MTDFFQISYNINWPKEIIANRFHLRVYTCIISLTYRCLSHDLHFRSFTGILLHVMFWLEKEKPVK